MPSNPALETKAKALQANLLNQKDYKVLIEAENVTEVVSYLKANTHYGKYLSAIDPEKASRVDIEAAFSKVLVDNTEKLLYFVQGSDKAFLRLILAKNNLDSFLILLRALAKGENLEKIKKRLSFSDKFSNFSNEKLEKVDDFTSFKEAIKGTRFYRAIETFDKVDVSDLFTLEKTLDRTYYDILYNRLKKLKENDYKKLRKIIRMEIDLLNIIWLYRAKRFYHMNGDEIIPYIYRGGYYLNEQKLAEIAYINDFDEFIQVLKSFRQYDFLFKGDSDLAMVLEKRMRRFLFSEFEYLSYFGKDLSIAYSYLRLLKDEASDIISIIEGKRYNLNSIQMQDYLIHPIQSS